MHECTIKRSSYANSDEFLRCAEKMWIYSNYKLSVRPHPHSPTSCMGDDHIDCTIKYRSAE